MGFTVNSAFVEHLILHSSYFVIKIRIEVTLGYYNSSLIEKENIYLDIIGETNYSASKKQSYLQYLW